MVVAAGLQQFNADGAGFGDVGVLVVGDDDADRGLTAGEVLGLTDDVDSRSAKYLGDGFNGLDGCEIGIVIVEAVAKTMPDDASSETGWSGVMTCCQEPSPRVTLTEASVRPRTWSSGSSNSATSLPEPLEAAL